MSDSAKAPVSSPGVMQTLSWVRKNNFRPVALRPRSKAAVFQKYTDPDFPVSPDSLWATNDYGLGVLLGPKVGGPVDIDLDCAEAVFFAQYFLPATSAVFGRYSKRASHYFYKVSVPDLAKIAFLDPVNKNTIVELRADGGHQTVLPGSIHEETGEIIEWAKVPFPEVLTVEAEPLLLAVKKIALATLIVRHLWHEGQRNEVTKPLAGMFYYCDWPEDETSGLIKAVMDFTGDTDPTRLRTVAATYKKVASGGNVTGATTLCKMTGNDKLIYKLQELAGSETVNLLQDYNERFAGVLLGNKFRVAVGVEKPSYPPIFIGRDDFIGLYAGEKTLHNGKPVYKSKVWLDSPRRRTYYSVDFVPGDEEPEGYLNLWTGWAVQPDSTTSCAGWLELLHQVICGGDNALNNWMLHWFANIVREPQNKAMTAPVIIGVQGAGKSLLINYFGKILGSAYLVVTDGTHLYEKFNAHSSAAILMHSEEALFAGDKKHRSVIKSLITDEHRILEYKGIDPKQIRNYLRLVMTSNEAHAAPAETNDRRFTVVDVGKRTISDELRDQVVKEMHNGGPAALLHYLKNIMVYDPRTARTNVKNKALNVLKSLGQSPMDSWWQDALSSGTILHDTLHWAQKPEKEYWTEVVSSKALYISMILNLRGQGARSYPTPNVWSDHLNTMVGVTLKRSQRDYVNPKLDGVPVEVRDLNNRQNTIVNMPSLADCRAAFEKYVGSEIEWPDSPPEEEKPTPKNFERY